MPQVDTVVKMLDPTVNLRRIAVKRRQPNQCKLGTVYRAVDVLRVATEPLTAREIEVLELVAKGMRNKEIGASLHISAQTAEGHLKSILSKLNVHDRTEAVTVAVRRGFLRMG